MFGLPTKLAACKFCPAGFCWACCEAADANNEARDVCCWGLRDICDGVWDTKCSGDTKQHSVEGLLGEAVVLQKNTRVRVNVWPWVLGLAVLGQHLWSNFVSGVCRHVTTLVVGVNGQIQSHKFKELWVGAVTKHVGKVSTVVQAGVHGGNLTVLEHVSVDSGGDDWQLGQKLDGVFVGVLPVLFFVDTCCICLGELGLRLQSSHSNRELGHRVQSGRGSVDDLFNMLWQFRSGSELLRKSLGLGGRRDLTGQQEPEKGLWKWLLTALGLRELLLNVRNGSSSEPNSFQRIQNRAFPDQTLDTSHTTIGLF
ncbi:hypothetical protein OGATHE_004434 [Ogataea polymorpha]|uniref:Uncharacterized protein n=1 Tax=Ogataea polymorpha TaxID=460523 RepID=A0A9P8NZ36_9ASCO|nr:hypothetical protein OGATHE_004434 [Ogataea polymorpha]